tara:strand:+ start:412 stop:648 length:237 start_codon:yes stop_codon:yes gene_type:complete
MNSTEDFDDSWIDPKHKKELLITIKQIYETAYPWADNVLMKCLVMQHYKGVIKNMNKEDYLKECEEEDNITVMIEQLF